MGDDRLRDSDGSAYIAVVKVTIDDVAKASGVSLATVSRALRGLPNVAPATRARVREAAEALGYEPDPSAVRLAAGTTSTIGLLAGNVDTWYAGRMLAGVERVLVAEGFDLLLSVADRSHPSAVVDRVRSLRRRVDGLLLVDLHLEHEEAEVVAGLVPTVVTAGSRTDLFDSVLIDNFEAAAAVARHLVRLGHRRIAMVDGVPGVAIDHSAPFERARGFRAGLAEAGIEPMETAYGEFTTGGGLAAGMRLLGAKETPTAVFAFSDEMAFGLLRAARSLGVRIPDDLSVVGFDDHDLADLLDLTTVRQDVVELGALAARRVLDRVEEPGAPIHEVAPTTLAVRGSTGPVPQGS